MDNILFMQVLRYYRVKISQARVQWQIQKVWNRGPKGPKKYDYFAFICLIWVDFGTKQGGARRVRLMVDPLGPSGKN